MTSWRRLGLYLWYSIAVMLPMGLPSAMTWLFRSEVGFNRIGFMSTWGSTPAAWACTTWARPISSPSFVAKLFSAMFWLLNGATFRPSSLNMRHSAAHSMDLPTDEPVPCSMMTFPRMSLPP